MGRSLDGLRLRLCPAVPQGAAGDAAAAGAADGGGRGRRAGAAARRGRARPPAHCRARSHRLCAGALLPRPHRHAVGLALMCDAAPASAAPEPLSGLLSPPLGWCAPASASASPARCWPRSHRLMAGAALPLPLPHRRAVGRALTALRHMRCCGCRSQTLCVSPGGGVPRPLQRRAVGRAVRNVPRHTMRRSNLPYKVWPLLCACA